MIKYKIKTVFVILIGTFFTLLLEGCRQTIDERQLQQINGLYYKLNDNDPFTGTVINSSKAGDYTSYYIANCTINYKNGQLDGSFICYSLKDKIKLTDMHYKNGLKHGSEKVWDKKDGGLKWTIDWKDGMHDGLEEQYNSRNGQLIEQIHWDNDKKIGTERKWNMNGDVLLEDLNWRNGKETGYRIYRDTEENYKDGKLNGINRKFELIGSFSEYQNLCADMDSRKAGQCAYILLPHYVSLEETYKNGELISSVTKYKDKEHELLAKEKEEQDAREKEQSMNKSINYD